MNDQNEMRPLVGMYAHQHYTFPRVECTRGSCERGCLSLSVVLMVIILGVASVATFYRACFWWDPSSHPDIGVEADIIGFTYFITSCVLVYVAKMYMDVCIAYRDGRI